ncbi:hypothetical protein DEJ34_03010 [Curtobacterium sp. MCPF17_050]|uniref:hypothetical protein n=1 Tax=Curtobacterium sp. MCPF17_050 TaxID=2175664 RepID=UPI000D923A43|nr:hypothetical protein [Curtobacterium sp. MCPF17_050]WIB16119.1 hypothetical protein DEJ34_03010 [Curtobacterium sp. MCPF17_050]
MTHPSISAPTPSAVRARTGSWTSVRTAAELLLGLSFFVTVASGWDGAAVGQATVVTPVAAVVFLVTVTCVLVSWFRELDQDSDGR